MLFRCLISQDLYFAVFNMFFFPCCLWFIVYPDLHFAVLAGVLFYWFIVPPDLSFAVLHMFVDVFCRRIISPDLYFAVFNMFVVV